MPALVLCEHDRSWAARFEADAAALGRALGPVAVAIHHIGSTAVEGLLAKPTVDILVEVTALPELDGRRPALEALGYRWRGEHGIAGRRYVDRKEPAGTGTHVHAFAAGHPELARHLRFRDALRASPQLRDAYAALKRALAVLHAGDRERYQAGKSGFIEATLREE